MCHQQSVFKRYLFGDSPGEHCIPYRPHKPPHPHWIEIDLPIDDPINVCGFHNTPRQDDDNGRIADYEFCVSDNGTDWTCADSGTFPDTGDVQKRMFEPIPGRYIRLETYSEVQGKPFTAVAEIRVKVLQ